jgi:pimeloyl-ACP methyl ester carboxylesterase
MTEYSLARRALITGASLGVGAGLAAVMAPLSRPVEAAGAGAEIWSGEYWAQKGEVKLNLWRKRQGAPRVGSPPLPVLFLVHGSSLSARTSYDLVVPGHGDYSLMNVLAAGGYDVWTMDHDGYGHSGSSGNNSDIASGVADLEAGIALVARETGRQKINLYGESSGGIRAAAYAQAQPERVERLVLSAFTYKGAGAAEIARRQRRIAELRANPRRKRDAAMIRSIFTRDGHASAYDPAVADDHRGRDGVRRHCAERHLSRHGGEPADRRSGQSVGAGADDAW